MLFKSVESAMTHQQRSVRISHLLPILALFTIAGHGSVAAQTEVVVNGVVNTAPRPTFYLTLPPSACGFQTFLLTWGTGTTKDGILVKPIDILTTRYKITDISKTNSQVTEDSISDIFAPSYNLLTCRLSFSRSWNTGDTKGDVPLKQGVLNTFQWETRSAHGSESGSFSSTLNFVAP
jgi:hypothetical protein